MYHSRNVAEYLGGGGGDMLNLPKKPTIMIAEEGEYLYGIKLRSPLYS